MTWWVYFKNMFKGALSGLRQFLATESPFKVIKNVFYFTLKALFVLKILKLLSWHIGHLEKRLGYKDKVSFKLYDVRAWLVNNWKHILHNISRRKDNQTMKFGQLLEYNTRNTFLEKLYTKCGGDTIPRPFSKNSKLSISLDQ